MEGSFLARKAFSQLAWRKTNVNDENKVVFQPKTM